MKNIKEPLNRFSDRVQDYAKYRPGYPPEVIAMMRERMGLKPSHRVADLGSGTGIFAKLLLENGNEVFAVEPNEPMRRSAEATLAEFKGFHSIAGTAEATTLPAESVDFLTAAQAFHWFDPAKVRAEALRILRAGGPFRSNVVILWNDRKTEGFPFLVDYQKLLMDHGTDYKEVMRLDEKQQENLAVFFGTPAFSKASFPYHQNFDYDGVKGRLLSSSYVPKQGQPGYEPMLAELRRIFDLHQEGGRIIMEYSTNVYFGPLR